MVKDFKYILKRILIGVGIALVLMALKDKSFILSANAKSYNFNVTEAQYVTRDDNKFTFTPTQYTVGKNSPVFYGYVSNSNSSYWTRFTFTLQNNSNAKSGLKNVSYIFHQAFVDRMLNKFTFNIFDSDLHMYSCTSDASNVATNNVTTGVAKYYVSVICPNIYYDTNKSYYVLIHMNNTQSNSGTWGITKPTFTDTEGSEIQSAINDTNDTIKDDSIDTNKVDSDLSTLNNKNATNGSITQLLTLPITLFQSILNSVNGSCSSFQLGSLLGTQLTMPCINLQNILGSTLYGIIDILLCGLFILAFRKKMVDIFNHMTSLNDRGNELE